MNDISELLAYWDRVAPLPPPDQAWAAPAPPRRDSPARIARELRLRAEAARQVQESRQARGVI